MITQSWNLKSCLQSTKHIGSKKQLTQIDEVLNVLGGIDYSIPALIIDPIKKPDNDKSMNTQQGINPNDLWG